jgi:DNA-binding transcriptional ArsR family regulator
MNEYPHKCLNVLGNKLRVDIIKILQEEDQTVTNLSNRLGEEQSKVSHSLKQLRQCNFVDYKKRGKEKLYFIKSEIFLKNSNKPIFDLVEEHVVKYCQGEEKK